MSVVIRMRHTGGPSVLVPEEEVVGAPDRGQVKLRQEAIGVNFIDTMFRSGAFSAILPFVTGVEASGVITQAGPKTEGFAVGDRVAYFFAPVPMRPSGSSISLRSCICQTMYLPSSPRVL
jgi:NADPH2:quinone reductase